MPDNAVAAINNTKANYIENINRKMVKSKTYNGIWMEKTYMKSVTCRILLMNFQVDFDKYSGDASVSSATQHQGSALMLSLKEEQHLSNRSSLKLISCWQHPQNVTRTQFS